MQLGRPPRGSWAVAARCHLGIPMVIANHPRLEDGAPFPTTYWLVCPVLVKRLGTLESRGWMRLVNDRLVDDPSLRARLEEAIASYRAERDAFEPIDDGGSPPGGGPARVKCLHAHAAHEIATGPNPIGALALSETGWPDCREACFDVRTT